MIFGDGLCSRCKRYHLPDGDHEDDCPELPRVFWSRESEQLYLRRLDMELRHSIEDRERRKAVEQAERERGKADAMLRETRREWHQQRAVEIAAQAEQLRGELSVARAQHDQQEAVRKLLRNQRVRDRAQSGEGR